MLAQLLAASCLGDHACCYDPLPTSKHFRKLLDEHGINRSMNRAGEIWDNSTMHSFFSFLKTERTARKVHQTRGHARSGMFNRIECFYNPMRRHSTLGYLSPEHFEQAQEPWVGVNATGSSPTTGPTQYCGRNCKALALPHV